MAEKKSCTESADLYEDLLKCPGAKRLPGTGRKVYLAPRRWITQLAKPQLEKAASMKDYLVIKESHTMAADKKFIVAYLATDKSNFSSEAQGENGSKTMLNKARTHIPWHRGGTVCARINAPQRGCHCFDSSAQRQMPSVR